MTVMTEAKIIERLKSFPLFAKWRLEDINHLAQNLQIQDFEPEDMVFSEDLGSDEFYVIHKGRIKQWIKGNSERYWLLRTMTEGQAFGQQTLFRGERYASKAEAETKCVLFRIDAVEVGWLLNRYPELWQRIIQPDPADRLRAIMLLRSLTDPQIEALARTVNTKEFEPSQRICEANDSDGNLWIIDWGQVEIRNQAQTDISTTVLNTTPASATVIKAQGFDLSNNQRPRLTAGNWFVGGQVLLRGQLTVTAYAVTKVKLIQIPAAILQSTADFFPDVLFLMQHRVPIAAQLEYLRSDSVFATLTKQQMDHLAQYAVLEHVPSGLTISKQGERASTLQLLIDGGAIAHVRDDQGRERPREYMQPKQPNNWYGISALLDVTRRDATVRSSTTQNPTTGDVLDGADWIVFYRDDLQFMLNEHPALWQHTTLFKHLTKPPEKREFKWLELDETVLYRGRRHWITLLPTLLAPLLIWLAFAAIFHYVFKNLAITEFLTNALVLGFLYIILLPIPLIDYFDDYYVITSLRIVWHNRRLIFAEARIEAPVDRVQDTQLSSNLLGHIVGYGDLMIKTAATTGTIPFKAVPNPEYVVGILSAQKAQAQAGRRAEQRERMRGELIGGLNLRMVPHRIRALPAGIQLPPSSSREKLKVRRVARRVARRKAWREFKDKLLRKLLFWLPASRQERVFTRRNNKKVKPTSTPDHVVYRKHWFFLIAAIGLPFIFFVGLGVLLVYVIIDAIQRNDTTIFGTPTNQTLIIIFIAWLPFLAIAWFKYENWHNDEYILTNTGIIDRKALPLGLREEKRQTTWDKIQNATFKIPSIWANLFDYGTVTIQTAATQGNFIFDKVAHPRQVQQEIFLRLEQFRLATEERAINEQTRRLSEAVQLYDELILTEGWIERSRRGSAPLQPGREPPPS